MITYVFVGGTSVLLVFFVLDTLKSLAVNVRDGVLSMDEAVVVASGLSFPVECRDSSGIYYVGEQDNVFYVVYSVLSSDDAIRFLTAIHNAML